MSPDLTDAQRALVNGEAGMFVPACPGAGKTRAVVHRYLRLVGEEPRKGVALLSFTNVAVREVRTRCGAQMEALDAPNFVGTFDGFINRYLTGPLYTHQFGRSPQFIDTWDALPSAYLGQGQFNRKISLEWFDFDAHGVATLVPRRARHTYQSDLDQYLSQNEAELKTQATERRNTLMFTKSVLACSASRWFTSNVLMQVDIRQVIARLLAHRFTEVIVDEAQDCGLDELTVLNFLRESGIGLTLVGDPDQAIYEFRDATPHELSAFVATLTPGTALDGNFRSSPAICAINNSLRTDHRIDQPMGVNAEITAPIQLIEYTDVDELAARIVAVAGQASIAESDVMVLSHQGANARRASGNTDQPKVGDLAVMRIAASARDLRSRQSDPRARLHSIERVEWLLLARAGLAGTPQQPTMDAVCSSAGVDRRWLRDAALRVAMAADPHECDKNTYTAAIRNAVNALRYPAGLQFTPTIAFFRKPSDAQWAKLGRRPLQDQPRLPWATIHSVKGQEFDAVALVLPARSPRGQASSPTALDHWNNGTDSEARRVLYVGASRARKLLMIAIPAGRLPIVGDILQRDNVPHLTHRVTNAARARERRVPRARKLIAVAPDQRPVLAGRGALDEAQD